MSVPSQSSMQNFIKIGQREVCQKSGELKSEDEDEDEDKDKDEDDPCP